MNEYQIRKEAHAEIERHLTVIEQNQMFIDMSDNVKEKREAQKTINEAEEMLELLFQIV